MRRQKTLTVLVGEFIVALTFFGTTTQLFAATPERVLLSFCSTPYNCPDGGQSWAGLIFDSAGHLYGTTLAGGNYFGCPGGCGTVFKLGRGARGHWTETVLHKFCSAPKCADGGKPLSSLIFDSAGNLYGTTLGGGSVGGVVTTF
jgi:uncharacterized repeat protein (TIGR03803 family)